MVPLQDPLRYFPLAQFRLAHGEQTALVVLEHPPLLYLPVPHDAQVEHTVSDVPEHLGCLSLCWPDTQLVHVVHWNPFVVPQT